MRLRSLSPSRRLAFSGLVLVGLYALARLIDTEQRWAALLLGGDKVEHAVVAYLLTGLALVAFPKVRLWIPPAAMIAVGVAIELVQALPQVTGGAQVGDVLADAAGALLVVTPMWLARARGLAGATGDSRPRLRRTAAA